MQGGDIGFLLISMFAKACCGATAIFFLIPLSSSHSSSSSICLPLLCHPFGVNCTNNLFCYNNTTPSGFVLHGLIGGHMRWDWWWISDNSGIRHSMLWVYACGYWRWVSDNPKHATACRDATCVGCWWWKYDNSKIATACCGATL